MSRTKRQWNAVIRQVRKVFQNKPYATGYVVGMELRLERDPERSVWVTMTPTEARVIAQRLVLDADECDRENGEAGYLI